MKKVIKVSELEEKTNELINYSKNNIQEKLNDLNSITTDFNWQGPAYDEFIKEYSNHLNKLNNMNKKLETLARFLELVFNNYSEANEKLYKMFQDELKEGNEV